MTRNDIIATKKSARELYKSIACPSGPVEAAKEPLTLGMMTNDFVKLEDDKRVTYAVAYCRACIDHVLSVQNRRDTFSLEIKNQLAMLWVQTFPDWTFADVRLFAHLLMTGFLPTYTSSNVEVAGFITFDIPGFFDKLHAYNKKRPGYVQRLKEERIDGTNRKDFSKEDGRPRLPIWQLEPFYQTHDWAGNEQPPENWNYKAYWAAKPTSEEVDEYCPNLRPKVHALITDKWQTQRKNNQETIEFLND